MSTSTPRPRIPLPRRIALAAAAALICAFAWWSWSLVERVAEQRSAVVTNIATVVASENAIADPGNPTTREALVAHARLVAEPHASTIRRAVASGDDARIRDAANELLTATRADNRRRSAALGQHWDDMKWLTAVALALGLSALLLAWWAEHNRAASRAIEERLQRAVADLERERGTTETLSEAKSQLLADVSHEIRTPMVALIGGIEMLAREQLSNPQSRRVETLLGSAIALRALLDDLIDLTRIDAESMPLHPRPFDPTRLLEDVVELHGSLAAARNIRIRLVAGELPPGLEGDPDRIRQVLNNLVSNALKFTPRGADTTGARVKLTSHFDDEGWHVAVDDQGPGIPVDARGSVRMRFVRLASDAPGTGLGLALSSGLVESMGGRMEISDAPGGGARVAFTLPLAATAAPASRHPSTVPPSTPPPTEVLLVEDSELNREIVREMLDYLGFAVRTAENGQEAIEAATERAPDLILMDCQMPVLDGLEATRRLRAAGYTGRIVALTASVSPDERAACDRAGMDEVLAKPLTLDELGRTVERAGLGRAATG